MRDGIPVPGSTKARLVRGALTEFGARGYADVGVTELARGAEVTIGSLYHHFGSKLGIYDAVRGDVERRLLDRMEGAAAVPSAGLGDVLLVGFDYLVAAGFARLLSEAHPERDSDPIAAYLAEQADHDGLPIGRVVIAAWRAALEEAANDGDTAAENRGQRARAALERLVRHL